MNCANCDAPALFVYDVPATDTLYYCNAHLPSFLRAQAQAGILPTTDNYDAEKAAVAEILAPEEPKKATKKAAAPVDEAPVQD